MRHSYIQLGLALAIVALAGCSPGPGAKILNSCLAMPSGDGQQWTDLDVPASDLLAPFQAGASFQRWKKIPNNGYAYRLQKLDPLTGAKTEIGIELYEAGERRTPICGPTRLGVRRMIMNNAEMTGWDLINLIPALIDKAGKERARAAAGPPLAEQPNLNSVEARRIAGSVSGQIDSTADLADGPKRGSCQVNYQDRVIMAGACSGKVDAKSVVMTAEHGGCTVELAISGNSATGKLFGYRDTCWLDEAAGTEIEGDVSLGTLTKAGACWSGPAGQVCPPS